MAENLCEKDRALNDNDSSSCHTADSMMISQQGAALLALKDEILNHWQAGIAMGEAFNRLFLAGGEDDALADAMNDAFLAFAAAQRALNEKAREVLK